MESSELMRRFCAAYYDEWITAVLSGQGGPILSAGICRSLEAIIGEADLKTFLESKEKEGSLKIIADYKSAPWDEPAWMLQDYM